MANKRPSGSYQDWQDDTDSPWVNILIGIVIIILVLGIGAVVYLNQDTFLGGEDGGNKTADTNSTPDATPIEESNAETEVADGENDEGAPPNEEGDEPAATSASDDSNAEDANSGDDETADESDEDTDTTVDESTSEDEEEPGDNDSADALADEDDSAPSGRVNLIENVPMRDILSIYAYPNPSIKLFSVLENFAPHAAGRYENWVYVYYFYTEVVMDEDGEAVLNRYHELRDGWIARGRLRLTDAQFNSLRVLNPDNLPALPNLEFDEETALPFVGLREVTPVPDGGDGSDGSASAGSEE